MTILYQHHDLYSRFMKRILSWQVEKYLDLPVFCCFWGHCEHTIFWSVEELELGPKNPLHESYLFVEADNYHYPLCFCG